MFLFSIGERQFIAIGEAKRMKKRRAKYTTRILRAAAAAAAFASIFMNLNNKKK